MTDTTKERAQTLEEIRGAVARGWCHYPNTAKEFDGDLAEAISQEILKLLAEATRPVQDELTLGVCPLCGSTQAKVFLGQCLAYHEKMEPAHIFHWPSTSDAQRAKMKGAPRPVGTPEGKKP